MNPGGWWEDAFRAAYLEVYHQRCDVQAAAEIAGLMPRLRCGSGVVIDAACGGGRHLAVLRAAGLPAVGFDLSPELLAVARGRPLVGGGLARGDLRAPPFADGAGSVLCLFTAFGYFDDAANAACLAALGRMVAGDGWLVLDLLDPQRVRSGLCAESVRTTPAGWQVIERRRLEGCRVIKTVEATPPGAAPVRWEERVRLHSIDEVAALARGAGLRLAECWRGLGGPTQDDGRLVAWITHAAQRCCNP